MWPRPTSPATRSARRATRRTPRRPTRSSAAASRRRTSRIRRRAPARSRPATTCARAAKSSAARSAARPASCASSSASSSLTVQDQGHQGRLRRLHRRPDQAPHALLRQRRDQRARRVQDQEERLIGHSSFALRAVAHSLTLFVGARSLAGDGRLGVAGTDRPDASIDHSEPELLISRRTSSASHFHHSEKS